MPLRCQRRSALIVLASFAFAAPALAGSGFGEKSAEIWSARNLRIAAAIDQPTPTSDNLAEAEAIGNSYMAGIKDACTGISGEHIQYGGKNMPVWAQTAQQRVCLGADQLRRAYDAGKKDKSYCGSLRSAMAEAKKATADKYPQNVVESAQKLSNAANALYNARITLRKTSLFGDSELVFTCS